MEHTFGKLKRASEFNGDEYAVNILSEKGYLLAKTQTNVYFDFVEAEANAARIVESWNAYDELKAENEHLKLFIEQNGEEHRTLKAENERLKADRDIVVYVLRKLEKIRPNAGEIAARLATDTLISIKEK